MLHRKFSSSCWWSRFWHDFMWWFEVMPLAALRCSCCMHLVEKSNLYARTYDILWYLCIYSIPYDAVCNKHVCIWHNTTEPSFGAREDLGTCAVHRKQDITRLCLVWTHNISQWRMAMDSGSTTRAIRSVHSGWPTPFTWDFGSIGSWKKWRQKHHATMLQSIDSELVSDLCVKHALLE